MEWKCKIAFDEKDPFQRRYLVLEDIWYIQISKVQYDAIKRHEFSKLPRDSKGRFIKRS